MFVLLFKECIKPFFSLMDSLLYHMCIGTNIKSLIHHCLLLSISKYISLGHNDVIKNYIQLGFLENSKGHILLCYQTKKSRRSNCQLLFPLSLQEVTFWPPL